MRNIELMVIGAQKAGTTSLSNYLGEHPSLLNPLCMEFTWFNQAEETSEGLGEFMARYYPPVADNPVRYIAKMSNLYRYRSRLAALHEHFPNCQLALVVRDPVQRAYSAYRMACFDGWMTFDPGYMAELIRTGRPGEMLYDRFIGYGLYAEALEDVWSIFPREQVHVFRFEDLKRHPQWVCDELFASLGLGPHTLKGKEKVHNETVQARSSSFAMWINRVRSEGNPIKRTVRSILPYPLYLRIVNAVRDLNRSDKPFPPLDPAVQQEWGRFYKDHDERLAAMTGLDLSGWISQRTSSKQDLTP